MSKYRLKMVEVFPPVWEVCSRTRSLGIPLRRLNLRQKPVAALFVSCSLVGPTHTDTHTHLHKFGDSSYAGPLYAFVTFQWHAQHHQKLCPSFVPFFGEHLAADLAKSQALRLCGRLLWRPRRSAFMSSHSLLLRIPSCPMMFHYVSPLSAEYFSVCNVPCPSLILVSLYVTVPFCPGGASGSSAASSGAECSEHLIQGT